MPRRHSASPVCSPSRKKERFEIHKQNPDNLPNDRSRSAAWFERLCLAIILLGLPLLFLTPGFHYSNGAIPLLWNLAHVPFFLAIVWLALQRTPQVGRFGPLGVYLICALTTLAVSVPIELLQDYSGREFSSSDIFLNWLGSMIAVSFHPLGRIRAGSARWLPRVAWLMLFAWQLQPISIYGIDSAQAIHRFPVLANFETPFQIHRWSGQEIALRQLGGGDNQVLGAIFAGDGFSNLSYRGVLSDWRDFECLTFRLFSDEARPITLNLRIHDRQHQSMGNQFFDRFNTPLSITPGWNRIAIDLEEVAAAPRDRSMDMSQIEELIFYGNAVGAPVRLYIDDLELVNRKSRYATCQMGHALVAGPPTGYQ